MLLKMLKSTKKIWIEKKLAGASNIHGPLKKPTEQPKQSKDKEKPSASSPNNPQKVSNHKSNKS
ncbi:hypothetical protein THII_0633 [Thioploca ingrica]|uniref:Uncharacterized protein n=1 Tax=Thioploca ingrica TaxID=40754 RepID=A0A090AJ79_9GAMM|nr:hypothetical protein THII_0633 [Thioploca ingrica]